MKAGGTGSLEQGEENTMNGKRIQTILTVLFLALASAATLSAQDREIAKVEEAIAAFNEITAIPDKTIPDFLLLDAQGIAIIPGVLKVGFVLGGQHGKGLLLLPDEKGGWSNPVFITLSGGSVGWQIGAQSTDIVLVFKTKKSVEGVLRGKFTLGVDVAAAAGPVGRRANASTDLELKAEIYSYSRSRGFFAGLSLDGAVLQIDDQANAAFYDTASISPQDILEGKNLRSPAAAVKLRQTVQDYLDSIGR
jgi:lipid-binding SYLF domain-containing protein